MRIPQKTVLFVEQTQGGELATCLRNLPTVWSEGGGEGRKQPQEQVKSGFPVGRSEVWTRSGGHQLNKNGLVLIMVLWM